MILESLKNKNNDCICFYTPTHWAVVTWSWNSYQEPLVESSPHRLKLELTAEPSRQFWCFCTDGVSVHPVLSPQVVSYSLPRWWDLAEANPNAVTWTAAAMLGIGWRVALLCSVKNGHCPWIFCRSKLFQRYFLKVRLMKTPWVLHDFKCPSNTLNLFCHFPSNMFSIFSPLIWKWCDWNSPLLPVCRTPLSTALACLQWWKTYGQFWTWGWSLVKMRHQNISNSVYIQGKVGMSHVRLGWFENAAVNNYDLPTCTTIDLLCIFRLFYLYTLTYVFCLTAVYF